MSLQGFLILALPAASTALLVFLLRRSRLAATLADHPNERSLHCVATPRLGGLAMMVSLLVLVPWMADAVLRPLWLLAALLCALSFADDVKSLPVFVRLTGHGLAAALAVTALSMAFDATLHFAWLIALALAIAWMTNLYNFMDGSDGLAGGMTAIGFGGYAVAAMLAGQPGLAWTSAAIASAALGFLAFNFPPARVFLGDAGSIPLGFLAGALGLHGVWSHAWPPWFPLLVFSPFVIDSSVTLVRRLLRGERLWRAHREHYYQRLVLGGWSRARLALAAYALMVAVAGTALAARAEGLMLQCGILVFWLGAYAAIIFSIERRAAANASS